MHLTIDLNLFYEITIENCLNCNIAEELEKMVQDKIQSSINKMSKYKKTLPSSEDKIKFILSQSLLKISSSKILLKNKDNPNLTLELLYTIIKKQFYIQVPFLLT